MPGVLRIAARGITPIQIPQQPIKFKTNLAPGLIYVKFVDYGTSRETFLQSSECVELSDRANKIVYRNCLSKNPCSCRESDMRFQLGHFSTVRSLARIQSKFELLTTPMERLCEIQYQ